jgi:hypothetical protein
MTKEAYGFKIQELETPLSPLSVFGDCLTLTKEKTYATNFLEPNTYMHITFSPLHAKVAHNSGEILTKSNTFSN